MAALATDTSCLVLTGGLYPDKQVIAKAYESRVPVLLTSHDTLHTAELIDHLIARIDPDNKKKIEKIKHLVADNVDLKASGVRYSEMLIQPSYLNKLFMHICA